MEKIVSAVLLTVLGLATYNAHAWKYNFVNKTNSPVHLWLGFTSGNGTHFEIGPQLRTLPGEPAPTETPKANYRVIESPDYGLAILRRIDAMRTDGTALNNEVEARWRSSSMKNAQFNIFYVDENNPSGPIAVDFAR